MKEHTAKELEGHRIRIEGSGKIPTGRSVQITDLDTGEIILNVTSIQLFIVPREVITAQLVLLHIGKMEDTPDGGRQAPVHEEKLTVHHPEIDLMAFVSEVTQE